MTYQTNHPDPNAQFLADLRNAAVVDKVRFVLENSTHRHPVSFVGPHICEVAAEKIEALQAELALATAPIPEGCTPTDARVLREANHELAQESHEMKEELREIVQAYELLGMMSMPEWVGDVMLPSINRARARPGRN